MARPFGVHLSVEGTEPMSAVISRWDAQINDISEIAEPINEAFQVEMEKAFASEGRTTIGKWVKLSPLYREWKAKHFPGRPILTRTGRLRASLTSANHPEHGFAVLNRTTMQVGTSVPYAGFHQTGRGRLPARPIIRFTKRFQRQVVEVMRDRLLAIRDGVLKGRSGGGSFRVRGLDR